MPNIAFAPRPMVDPYAGKAGEILGNLFETIGQIHTLRQQRNQTNAILDIMKSGLPDEQKRSAIINVARNGGDVMRNMIARQGLSESLIPESERQSRQASLEYRQAATERMKQGGGAAKSALERQWESKKKRRDDFQERYEKESDPAKEAEWLRKIQKLNEEMDAIYNPKPGPTAEPAPAPFKADVDAVTMAAPVTGQSQQTTPATMPSPGLSAIAEQWLTPEGGMPVNQQFAPGQPPQATAGLVGPPVPPVYGVVLKSFKNTSDISSADKQARKELVAKGLAKDDDQAASMVMDAVEKMPGLNKVMPAGVETGRQPGAFAKPETPQTTPQQTKADAAIAEIVAPETGATPQADNYGYGPGGRKKGKGFFGELKLPGGGVTTEYSVGVRLESKGGKETNIPSLVPTLTPEERALMINDIIPGQKHVPKDILQKAVDHANMRVKAGRDVFFQEGEEPTVTTDEELDALPSGTLFIAPNGELRRKK